MEKNAVHVISPDGSDDEIFVYLESEECDSDGTLPDGAVGAHSVISSAAVSVTDCDTVVISNTSNTGVYDTQSASDVSVTNSDTVVLSSTSCTVVYDTQSASDVESANIGLSETIITSEEGKTTLSETAASSDRSGDTKLLPVHSVTVAMDVNLADGHSDNVGSGAMSDFVTSVISSTSTSGSTMHEALSLSNDVQGCASHMASNQTSTVCCRQDTDSATLWSYPTASRTGVHIDSSNVNLIDISQAKSVDLRELTTYSGLKYPQILLTRVEDEPHSSSCVTNSPSFQHAHTEIFAAPSSTSDSSQGAVVFSPRPAEATSLLQSAEVSCSLSADAATVNAPVTVTSTKEHYVVDVVLSSDDDDAAVDSSLPAVNESGILDATCNTGSDGFCAAEMTSDFLESKPVDSSNDDPELVATDDYLYRNVGPEQLRVGDSVESRPLHEQNADCLLYTSDAADE